MSALWRHNKIVYKFECRHDDDTLLLCLYIYDSVIEKYCKCLLLFNLKYIYFQIICCLLVFMFISICI